MAAYIRTILFRPAGLTGTVRMSTSNQSKLWLRVTIVATIGALALGTIISCLLPYLDDSRYIALEYVGAAVLVAGLVYAVVGTFLLRAPTSTYARITAGCATAVFSFLAGIVGLMVIAHAGMTAEFEAMMNMEFASPKVEAWCRNVLTRHAYPVSPSMDVALAGSGSFTRKGVIEAPLALPTALEQTHPMAVLLTQRPDGCLTTKWPCIEIYWHGGLAGLFGVVVTQEPLKPSGSLASFPGELRKNVYWYAPNGD